MSPDLRNTTKDWATLAQEWFADMSIAWRPTYRTAVETIIRQHLLPRFGTRPLQELSRGELLRFRTELATQADRPLGNARINQVLGVLRSVCNEGSERYGMPRLLDNVRPLPQERVDIRPLSLAEVRTFLTAVRADYRDYYELRFCSGLRSAEVDALQVRHVCDDRSAIEVDQAVIDGRIGPPKNVYSRRAVEIPAPLHLRITKLCRGKSKSDFLFATRTGMPRDTRTIAKRVWHPTLQKAGLPRLRQYATRHTAATLWLASGESPAWIARQLGHATTEMLHRRYSKFVRNAVGIDGQRAAALWDSTPSFGITNHNNESGPSRHFSAENMHIHLKNEDCAHASH